MSIDSVSSTIKDFAEREGTDLQSSLRDMLTDIRSAAQNLGLDFNKAVEGSFAVFADETFDFDTKVQLLVNVADLEDEELPDRRYFVRIIQDNEMSIDDIYEQANKQEQWSVSVQEVKETALSLYEDGFLEITNRV